MLQKLKASASEFAHGKAGRRFEDRYHHARKSGHGMGRRALVVSLGLFIFLLGIILVPAPGPGFLIMLVGATLVAQESIAVAMRLDLGELWLRGAWIKIRRYWKRKATAGNKAALVAAAVCILGGATFGAVEILQH